MEDEDEENSYWKRQIDNITTNHNNNNYYSPTNTPITQRLIIVTSPTLAHFPKTPKLIKRFDTRLANGPFLIFDFRKSKTKNGPLASIASNYSLVTVPILELWAKKMGY